VKELAIAGAGMAGLVAAARARELGADVVVFEKGDRPGGSMVLSSCVIWRFRTIEDFRAECPGGDAELQQTILSQLDESLDWLTSLGAPVVGPHDVGSRVGLRLDPPGLRDALVRAAGEIRLRTPFEETDAPLVLATGGFPVRLARERGLLLRANPWSEGDGLDHARSRGAAIVGPLDEFYGRALPAPPARIQEEDFVRLSQHYRGEAQVVDERGESFFDADPSWSENDLAQAIARRPAGRAWFILERDALADEDVAMRVDAARRAGGTVIEEGNKVRVHVAAAVTHTIGGLRIDKEARVLREDGAPVERLYAAGVDAGGVATGGYASGLAQALVLGRIAAETAVGTSMI
jgi:fumarate reductase flavoprotein subunit